MSRTLISIRNVSFQYSRQRLILNKIHAELAVGQTISLLGPNGAGKTTLLKCIMGLLKPSSGEIIAENRNILDLTYRERAKIFAYVPQHSVLVFNHTVRDYVAMGLSSQYPMWKTPSAKDMKNVDKVIERMELSHLANTPFRFLSGGEQQKTTIARALVQEPKVLLFDEPTSALDLGNQNKVLMLIRSLAEDGYSIIMTTHNPDHPFVLNSNVWMLGKRGDFHTGTLTETMTSRQLSELYETTVEVVELPKQKKTICVVN